MFRLLLTAMVSVLVESESAKILGVFPMPSISHQVVFRPLMQELAKRGHEVTVITTDPAFPKGQAPENLTEIDLHDFSYEYWNDFLAVHGKEPDQIVLIKRISHALVNILEKQLKSNEVQKFIQNNKNIDLLFVESGIQPALIFSDIYKVPVIEFSSLGGLSSTFAMIGATTHPLIYPDLMRRRIYNLTLWEKIENLYTHYSMERLLEQYTSNSKLLKTVFGPDVPSMRVLRKNVHMIFLNVHPIWDFNRPVPPNVIYLGGLHQKPVRDLPEDLKTYLDSSKHGVIYISFGTNVKPSFLPRDKLKIFTDVFSQLPYDVLWKWDNEELPGRPSNVKILKWLPQSDLLRHPNIKLFITQGGLQSTDEAITAAVPLVGIPMLGDQWFNVEHYVRFKIGKKLLLDNLTEDQLLNAIKSVIEEKCYRQNIIKLRNIMQDQPQKPLDRAVWWTEHILRRGGGEHLRTPAAHMHWTEYYEVDLLIVLLGTVLLVVPVTILVYSIYKYIYF
ncbi:UDP-glucosyltransferase 2-like [Melitaea cinxia]|uniref:UDP-glucosyltransferase 2-like n=1 Tax=Melitaea cinxia TaxID=113334 RepID=UPI001E2736DC|nr:UDP-glucosyltransferase 2-like [Melitaea cinxia]